MIAVTAIRAGALPTLYLPVMHTPRMTPRKKGISRDHRKRPTWSENLAWNLLRDRRVFGLKFRRQHVIRGYILDFYCHDLMLAIEVDGDSHLGREKYDALRQRRIEKEGIAFIRINANELIASPERLVEQIRLAKVLREGVVQKGSGQCPSPPLSPRERGEPDDEKKSPLSRGEGGRICR